MKKKSAVFVGLIFLLASCGGKPSGVSRSEVNSEVREWGNSISQEMMSENSVVLDPTDSEFDSNLIINEGVRGALDPSEIYSTLYEPFSIMDSFFQSGGSLSPVLKVIKKSARMSPLQDDEFGLFLQFCADKIRIDTNEGCNINTGAGCTYAKITFDGTCKIGDVTVKGQVYVEFIPRGEDAGYVNINIDITVDDPSQGGPEHIVLKVFADIISTGETKKGDVAFFSLDETSSEFELAGISGSFEETLNQIKINSLEANHVYCPSGWVKFTDCHNVEHVKLENFDLTIYGDCDTGEHISVSASAEYASWDGMKAVYLTVDIVNVEGDECTCMYLPVGGTIIISDGTNELYLDFTNSNCTCPSQVTYNDQDMTQYICP